jgi:hypothetical protein
MYRLSNPSRERYTELMAQVDRLKLHSTKLCQSRLVTVTQLNIACELRVARRKKVVSEVSEGDVSDTTTQRHNSTNF